eukprot:snap_masked-scaffold_3-processed-gene-14.35-mRNA-1 protein AED:1.00 eAED:1.00 QI:0/0/0/0/1/1/2/0/69
MTSCHIMSHKGRFQSKKKIYVSSSKLLLHLLNNIFTLIPTIFSPGNKYKFMSYMIVIGFLLIISLNISL